MSKWAVADFFCLCLECLPSSYLAGDLIFMFFKSQLVSPLPNTVPAEEITASFPSTSSKHLDCYTHNTLLQLFVCMALLTIRLWSPWGQQLDLIYLFIASIQWHIVDAHRCRGSKVEINEPYVFCVFFCFLFFFSYFIKGEVHLGAVVSCRSIVGECAGPVMPPLNNGVTFV